MHKFFFMVIGFSDQAQKSCHFVTIFLQILREGRLEKIKDKR